jgi:hypothetical protein
MRILYINFDMHVNTICYRPLNVEKIIDARDAKATLMACSGSDDICVQVGDPKSYDAFLRGFTTVYRRES